MEIARGEIDIALNDSATPELRRIEAEYRAAMARIDRMEAAAQVGLDLKEFDAEYKRAKDRVRELEGMHATVELDADKEELTKAITEARAEVKRLDGQRATIQIETRGTETALANIEKVRAAEAARAAAEDKYARQRQRIADNEERDRAKAERSAYRENEIRRKADLDMARSAERVGKLRLEYARLTDEIERTNKGMRGFHTTESRAKLSEQHGSLTASLERVKAELNYLGGNPPVKIKVDNDYSNVRSRFKRMLLGLRDDAKGMGGKALEGVGSMGNLRLALGPISGTLRSITIGAAALSPVITSLGGALTSLVGVLGTGIAGAGAVAGGVMTGLALNFGGVLAAVKPAMTDFHNAELAVKAYTKATQQYGKGSKEAKTAQQNMNNMLKNVSPTAREAAQGVANLGTTWQKLTGAVATRDVGQIMAGGVKMMTALMPGLARNTNATFGILTRQITGFEKSLSTPAAVRIFDSLGASANKFLNPVLTGLGHLGAAFGHIGESAARIFAGPAGNAFNRFAASIDRATQPGQHLDDAITRIGHHAGDLLHLFASVGRLLATVFNGSADSGDRMVTTLSNITDRWGAFLKTTKGQQDMSRFFSRSADDAMALVGALSPLIGAFVQWSNLLAPFTTGILQGVSAVARLVGGFTRLVGLGGPMSALGATFGAVFAIGKIGAFVGMLSRVWETIRMIRAESGTLGALGSLFTGKFGSVFKQTGGITAAGESAAAAMGAAITEAGAAAAAEMGGAIRAAGAVAGAEEAAGMASGGAAGAVEGAVGGGLAAAAGGAGIAAGEIGGVETAAAAAGGGLLALDGIAATVATGGLALAAGAAIYLGIKLLSGKNASDQLHNAIGQNGQALARWRNAARGAAGASANAGQSMYQYRNSIKDVNGLKAKLNSLEAHGKSNTQEYRNTLDQLNGALVTRGQNEQAVNRYMRQASTFQQQETAASNKRIDAQKNLKTAQENLNRVEHENWRNDVVGRAKAIAAAEQNVAQARNQLTGFTKAEQYAEAQATIAQMNYKRGLADLIPLTGKAASALAKLSSINPSVAAKVSVKYADPKDAGHVAQAAQKALGAGVSQKVTMHIVAESSNAEQAIRRLNAARMDEKRLKIRVDEGNGLAVMARMNGIKLNAKTLRLLHQGDPEVIATVRRIIGMRIPGKTQNINQQGGPAVIGMIQRILGMRIADKVFSVIAHDQASGIVSNVARWVNSLHDKTIAIRAVHIGPLAGKASGGPFTPQDKRAPGVPPMASAGRSDASAAARQALVAANRAEAAGVRKTKGGIYKHPTLLVGEEDRTEYVIATNPAYHRTNVEYLKAAAADLGYTVDPAAKGKKKHHKKKYKPPVQSGNKLPGGNPGEEGATHKRLDAPLDRFEFGGVDESTLDGHWTDLHNYDKKRHGQVTALQKRLDSLKLRYAQTTKGPHGAASRKRLRQEADKLRKDLDHTLNGAPHGTVRDRMRLNDVDVELANVTTNRDALKSYNRQLRHLSTLVTQDQGTMTQAAQAYNKWGRQGDYDKWTGARDDIQAILNGGPGSPYGIGLLAMLSKARDTAANYKPKDPDAAIAQGDLVDSLNGTIQSANGDLLGSETEDAPTGPDAPPPPDVPTFESFLGATTNAAGVLLSDVLGGLNKDYAVAQMDNAPDDSSTPLVREDLPSLQNDLSTSQGLMDFYKSAYDTAVSTGQNNAVITDAANAYTQAKGTYQGIKDTIDQGNQSVADAAAAQQQAAADRYSSDVQNYSTARADLYQQMGSNFAPIWSQGGPDASGQGAFGGNPATQSGAGSTTVTVNNTFPTPPPDPHSWSQGVAWELGAAI